MSALLGLALGGGVLLVVSPLLWSRRGQRTRNRAPGGGVVRERLVQAGLERVSPALVVAVSAVMGVIVGTVVVAATAVFALGIAAVVVAACLPATVIAWRARSRRRAVRVVWPDVVDQLVSAVRSGLALPDGLSALGETGPAHTRQAFAAFASDYRATGNFSMAVEALKGRLADPVADRILETLRMSREVGGSELVTVLRNLGSNLRQHIAIRSEAEARQSWVVNAARLGVAAPWIVLLLLATRPEAAAAYNSPPGTVLIVSGLVVTVAAYRVMIGLGRLPEERRWFA